MSFGGGGGSQYVPPPEPPPPPPAPVQQADTAVVDAGVRARNKAKMGGYMSTIKTGGDGVLEPAKTAPKSLLGE